MAACLGELKVSSRDEKKEACSDPLLFVFRHLFFLLPNREFTTVRKSGLHSEFGKNPAVENEPDDKYTDKQKKFHGDLLCIHLSIYKNLISEGKWSYEKASRLPSVFRFRLPSCFFSKSIFR